MDIFRHNSKDDIAYTQTKLQKNYLPTDTWGVIDLHDIPEQAEKDFCRLICSEAAKKEQAAAEQLAQLFPDKYGYIVPAGNGKTEYSIFPTEAGTKILFVSNYAQKSLKKIFTTKTMGAGMKIHTAKIRNRFEPSSWKQASWFFVAYALITGNDNEFATIDRYS